MRRCVIASVFFFLGLALHAQNIRVGVLNGPSCVPAAKLMDEKSEIEFTQFPDPQALLPKLLKKEVDAGFLPVNVAAKVYNSSPEAIVMCAVTGNGNVKLLTTDKSVRQLSDLKDVELYVAGQGAVPDYMTRYLLRENEVKESRPDGAELIFSVPTAQIAAWLVAGKIKYAVVPEPFATVALMKSKDVRVAVDYTEEYKLLNGTEAEFPLTVLVSTRDFAEKNPEVLERFLSDYERSFKWTLSHARQSGALCEKASLGLSAAVVAKAVPVSNYTFVPASQARHFVEDFLSILLEFSPDSVGGTIPDSGFYLSSSLFDAKEGYE